MSDATDARLFDVPHRLHFMGIGGAGMSGLAEIAHVRGHRVSGCDVRSNAVTERLAALGLDVLAGHNPAHLIDVDALVVSSAVPVDEPELCAARERGIEVVRRAEFLAAVMDRTQSVAVAGTHGKSTTTSMTGAILEADGRDPTVIVGGRIRGQPGNVRIGGGAWVVAEADEFDRSFLALEPIHAVITNLEADHLDTYRDMDDVRAAFAAFANLVPVGGTLVLNAEDPELGILPRPAGRRVVTFGLVEGADARAEHIVADRLETRFTLVLDRENVGQITLRMPGLHNVRNALAAAALGWSLAVAPTAIREGLAVVRGVERRFDIVHEDEEVIIVDDYAHHPTEVRATLTSARAGWPERRLVAVFQPHLYTRTRDFAAGFGDALSIADVVFVTDVYPAREAPIEGVDGRMVSAATRRASDTEVHDTPGVDVAAAVAPSIRSGDLVITLGAGDIDRVAHTLAAELRHEKGRRA